MSAAGLQMANYDFMQNYSRIENNRACEEFKRANGKGMKTQKYMNALIFLLQSNPRE